MLGVVASVVGSGERFAYQIVCCELGGGGVGGHGVGLAVVSFSSWFDGLGRLGGGGGADGFEGARIEVEFGFIEGASRLAG